MTQAVQLRKGTTAEHTSFTGLQAEATVDTTKKTLVVHDGSTAGGIPLSREDLSNSNPSNLTSIAGADTASGDFFVVYDVSASAFKKITRAELNNAMEQDALASVAITGGTINGTTIGGTTAAAGSFTTITASGNVTLSGGTANGVLYLNGSKVATSGSALTFDGTTLVSGSSGTTAKLILQGGAQTSMAIKSSTGTSGFLIGRGYASDDANSFFLYDLATSQNRFYIDTTPNIFQYATAHVWNNAANSTEYMRLTSTGLGIGTSSPGTKLEVGSNDSTAKTITLRYSSIPSYYSSTFDGSVGLNTLSLNTYNTSSGTASWSAFSNTSYGSAAIQLAAGTGTSNSIRFLVGTAQNTTPTEFMRLDSSGNLGIGTSSPGAKLNVAGAAGTSVNTILANGTTTGANFWRLTNTGGDGVLGVESSSPGGIVSSSSAYATVLYTVGATPLQLGTNSSIKATLDTSGNLGLGVTPSAWGSNFRSAIQGPYGNYALYADQSNYARFGLASNAFHNGTAFTYVNSSPAAQYQQFDGVHRWFTAPSGTAGDAITFTQAMTLDASGRLNVGMTGGTDTLNVAGSLALRALPVAIKGPAYNSENIIYSYYNAGDNTVYTELSAPNNNGGNTGLIFRAGQPSSGTIPERARITSGGYFKASNDGTYQNSTGSSHEFYQTANSVALDIKATNASYDQSVCFLRTDRAANSAFQFLFCNANGVGQFYVRGDGTIYAQNTTVQSISDVRVKENIRNSSDGLNVINAIRPVRFDFKPGFGNDRKNQLGFIAQEIETVFPDAVENISLSDEKDEPYKSVGPGALIPVLVKAIQEQQALITSLTARVALLEGN